MWPFDPLGLPGDPAAFLALWEEHITMSPQGQDDDIGSPRPPFAKDDRNRATDQRPGTPPSSKSGFSAHVELRITSSFTPMSVLRNVVDREAHSQAVPLAEIMVVDLDSRYRSGTHFSHIQ